MLCYIFFFRSGQKAKLLMV